ncbi:MAG: PaaI family thioesterase [Bacteroidota bacterium]
MKSKYFQDHLIGNVCFGCGRDNELGLQISSFWEGKEAVCYWQSEEKYQGWKGIMNGGILATLIDCHCMNTAMAAAYAAENRNLDSEPIYRYATGTITVKYLRPTPNDVSVELRARVEEIKGRKVILNCIVKSSDIVTAEAKVIAIRVYDSSEVKKGAFGG